MLNAYKRHVFEEAN